MQIWKLNRCGFAAAGACDFAHDPNVPATQAPAFWLPEVAPGQVILTPGSYADGVSIDPTRLGDLTADREDRDGRYFILADEGGDHHGWLRATDTVDAGPAAIVLPIDGNFPLRDAAAQRFHRRLIGERAGPLPRRLQLTRQRRARLALMLRALDGREAGALPRTLAAALLDPIAASVPVIEWKSSALRRSIHRLLAEAFALREGGYLKLLRGDWPYVGD